MSLAAAVKHGDHAACASPASRRCHAGPRASPRRQARRSPVAALPGSRSKRHLKPSRHGQPCPPATGCSRLPCVPQRPPARRLPPSQTSSSPLLPLCCARNGKMTGLTNGCEGGMPMSAFLQSPVRLTRTLSRVLWDLCILNCHTMLLLPIGTRRRLARPSPRARLPVTVVFLHRKKSGVSFFFSTVSSRRESSP